MSFSFLQCPLQVKKIIRENSAKYVNQTWFLFYIRDFIWIISLTEKSKIFEEDLKVYCNLKETP